MLQKDVAEQLGVDKTSVFNWEANTATPEIRYMPAIIDFLGYNPLPAARCAGRAVGPPADQPGAFAEGVRQASCFCRKTRGRVTLRTRSFRDLSLIVVRARPEEMPII